MNILSPDQGPGATGERCFAVVVNHHGPGLLARCLETLATQGLAGLRVIVVDNASPWPEVEAALPFFPGARLVRNTNNPGFAAAANQGLRLALAEGAWAVLVLNNDAFLQAGCLRALTGFLAAAPWAGACQPLLVDDHDPASVQSAGCRAGLTGRAWDDRQGRPTSEIGSAPFEILAPSGAAALYLAQALDRTGLFDQSFGMYFEDVDLGLRLRRAGFRPHCLPAARVRHVGRGSARPLPHWRRIFLCEKNALLAAAAAYPRPLALAALALGPLSSLAPSLYHLASGRLAPALAYPAGALCGALAGLPRLLRRMAGDQGAPLGKFLSPGILYPPGSAGS